MSGFIAVSVSLIGLTGALFTLAIFIQMIISFPAMLSSNSQAYVSQQRTTYTIGTNQEAIPSETTAGVDAEWEYEHEQEPNENSVERWIDLVEEATNSYYSETQPAGPKGEYYGTRRTEQTMRGRSRGSGGRTTPTKAYGRRAQKDMRIRASSTSARIN